MIADTNPGIVVLDVALGDCDRGIDVSRHCLEERPISPRRIEGLLSALAANWSSRPQAATRN